jgi:streptogramin lyase
VGVRLFAALALFFATPAATPRVAPAVPATADPRAVSFDEIRRGGSAILGDAKEETALAVLRSAPIAGFQSDYDWYVSHAPDQYGERHGPGGEYIALYRYAFFGHWSRFESGNHVTIVYDGTNPQAFTLDLAAHTYHRFSDSATRNLLAHKPYAPALPPHYEKTDSIGGHVTIERSSAIHALEPLRFGGIPAEGLTLTQTDTLGKPDGSCIKAYEGILPGAAQHTLTGVAYRAAFADPGPAYNLNEGLPFTEGEINQCVEAHGDLTPAVSAKWQTFETRFMFFEREESIENRGSWSEDSIGINERGHIRRIARFDAALFAPPLGFADDCTIKPRPRDCPAIAIQSVTIDADIALRGPAFQLALDSSGNVWFTEEGTNGLGYVTPSERVRELTFPVPASEPLKLAPGVDGDMWLTAEYQHSLWHIASDGTFKEFPNAQIEQFAGIVAGPNARVWFPSRTPSELRSIGLDGVLATVPLDTSYPATFAGIAFDADANPWYIQSNTQKPRIVRVRAGKLDEYTPPHDLGTLTSLLYDGGYMYFGEVGRLARVSTSTGAIEEFPLAGNSSPEVIVGDGTGTIWFAESSENRIGRLTPGGTIVECTLPVEYRGGFTIDNDHRAWISTKRGVARLTECHAIP